MKTRMSILANAILLSIWSFRAIGAPLEVLHGTEPQYAFDGEGRIVRIKFHNRDDGKAVESRLFTRIYQESSATAMPIGEPQEWKVLQVPPGQTVTEEAKLTFPDVRAVTVFQVRCLDDKTNEIGRVKVRVCPRDLLKQLAQEKGTEPVGILDPENQIKPLLKNLKIKFQDLDADAGFDEFTGKLAIVGPFSSREKSPDDLRQRIIGACKKPMSVVWILPPQSEEPVPNLYTVRTGESTVAIVAAHLVAHIADSPQAQINLLRCVTLALHPQSLNLPQSKP